jgi:hypothetical protein
VDTAGIEAKFCNENDARAMTHLLLCLVYRFCRQQASMDEYWLQIIKDLMAKWSMNGALKGQAVCGHRHRLQQCGDTQEGRHSFNVARVRFYSADE